MQPPHIHILDRIHSTHHYHSSKYNRLPRTYVRMLDVHDGKLDVDDGLHDESVLVHDDVILEHDDALEQARDDDAVLVHGGDAVLEQVHDVQLEHDVQDVVHVQLFQVLQIDVRHHEKVLPHDYHHLCWMVLVLLHDYLHHDYCVLVLMNAVELHHHVNAVRKSTLT